MMLMMMKTMINVDTKWSGWLSVCQKNIENSNYMLSAASYFIGFSIYSWQMYHSANDDDVIRRIAMAD